MNQIILLNGYARSGKDTFADILVNDYKFVKFAFASKLKELARKINVKINVNGYELEFPYWDGADYTKRYPCVELGAKLRKVLGHDVWINALKNDENFIYSVSQGHDIVISDHRYLNEYNIVPKNYQLKSVNISRLGCEPQGEEEESIKSILDSGMVGHYVNNDFYNEEDYKSHVRKLSSLLTKI